MSRRTMHVVVAIVVVAVVAVVAGIFIGRATKTGTTPKPSSSPSWQTLPQAPIAGRIGAGAVWTGKEMIVWGGVTAKAVKPPGNPCDRCASDGAAYDPAAHTWRTIASSPSGVQGVAGSGVAWTGNEMVVWASNSPDGPAGAAVYDPGTNRWRRLPAGPLGGREGYASAWTGKELLVVGGHSGDTYATPVAAAVDPRTGAWRLLPAFDRLKGFLPNGALWDGHEVVMTGTLALCPEQGSACADRRALFLAYDPASDKLREIPLPAPSEKFGSDTASSLTPIAWNSTEVVFTAAVPGSMRVIRYNPTIGGWNKKTTASCHIVENPAQGRGCRDWRMGPPAQCYLSGGQTAWAGNGVVAPCGKDGLQIFDLGTNAWRTITAGPSPLNSRESSAIVWTGTDLIAWSGSTGRPGGAPPDGASLTLKN